MAPFGGISKVVTSLNDITVAVSPLVEGVAEILKFVIEPVDPVLACVNLKLPAAVSVKTTLFAEL